MRVFWVRLFGGEGRGGNFAQQLYFLIMKFFKLCLIFVLGKFLVEIQGLCVDKVQQILNEPIILHPPNVNFSKWETSAKERDRVRFNWNLLYETSPARLESVENNWKNIQLDLYYRTDMSFEIMFMEHVSAAAEIAEQNELFNDMLEYAKVLHAKKKRRNDLLDAVLKWKKYEKLSNH